MPHYASTSAHAGKIALRAPAEEEILRRRTKGAREVELFGKLGHAFGDFKALQGIEQEFGRMELVTAKEVSVESHLAGVGYARITVVVKITARECERLRAALLVEVDAEPAAEGSKCISDANSTRADHSRTHMVSM